MPNEPFFGEPIRDFFGYMWRPKSWRTKAIRTGVVFAWIGGFVLVLAKFFNFASNPDLNYDGKFTISDLPHAAIQIVTEPGLFLQNIVAETPIGAFLELNAGNPSLVWSSIFSLIFWSTPFALLLFKERF